MLSIIIFRHGKSDWDASYNSDHDRPLSKRGRRAAKDMGRFLTQINQIPEQVISSSAMRAKNTAKLAMEHGNWFSGFSIESKIYGGSSDTLLDIIHHLDNKIQSVCLVGHEPTCSNFISQCTFHSQRFTTASMAKINYKTESWNEIKFGMGILDWIKSPKEIF
jgi:phosphohistidine phosphatase